MITSHDERALSPAAGVHDARSTTLAAIAALPPIVLAVATLAMLVAGMAGQHPMWRPETLNMTEAAAARDVATIAASIERGQDPNARRPIAPPFLEVVPGEMSPLEAGVIAGRLEVVHLLLTRGASVPPDRRVELACMARRRGYPDVADYLGGDAFHCDR